MHSVLTLLRIGLRSRLGVGKGAGKKAWGIFILSSIFSLIIYAVYVAGAYFITNMFVLGRGAMPYEFLVLATSVSIFIQIFTCTGSFIKNLYFDCDNALILRFPVDGTQMFYSKSVIVFIKTLLTSVFITMPFYIFYAAAFFLSAGFVFFGLFISVILSALPFFIAELIAIPVMKIVNAARNKFFFILILMILSLIAAFMIYILLLKRVMEYSVTKNATILDNEIINTFKSWAPSFVPANFYVNLLIGRKVILSIFAITGMTAAFGALGLLVAKRHYYQTVLDSLENQRTAYEHKTKDKFLPVYKSILKTEYLLIFRSTNYSFQYLAMAVAAPVMVYLCNDLACAIGDKSVGGRIIPGLSLLVILIFVTLIVAFASTTVSRTGKTFYLTKIIPVSYTYQILVKFSLYFIVATLSVLLSCAVVGIFFGGAKYGNYIGIFDIFCIFVIAELIIVTLTSIAISADLKSPSFDVNNDGELTNANKNVSNTIILGYLIAVLFGLASMILAFTPIFVNGFPLVNGINTVYAWLIGISLLCAIISISTLFSGLNKRYNKI